MMENGRRPPRRQLTPEEKWRIFLEVTSHEISQADAARKYGVDAQRHRRQSLIPDVGTALDCGTRRSLIVLTAGHRILLAAHPLAGQPTRPGRA